MRFRMTCAGVVLLLWTQAASAEAGPRNLCALFTAAEIAALLGTAVEPGEPAALGTGCQWFGKDETSFVILQVVEAEYWIDPPGAPGYEPLPGLGQKAYSHPDSEGGWRAMALTKNGVASVVAIAGTATRDTTVTLLRQLVERT